MPKIFCPECYKPTIYESSKPSFCSHCAKAFNQSIGNVVKPAPTPIPTKTAPKVIVEDNEDEVHEVPQNVEIQFEIQGNLRNNRQTFDQVLNEGFQNKGRILPTPPKKSGKREKNLSKDEVAKNWHNNFPKNGQRIDLGE